VDDVEGTGEPLGSSTGSEKNGKESTKSFSSKEYSQLTVNPKTSDDKTDIVYVA